MSNLPPGITDSMIDGLCQDPEELCCCDHTNREHNENDVCGVDDCECTEFDNEGCCYVDEE